MINGTMTLECQPPLYVLQGQPDAMMRHHTGVQQNRVKPFAPEPSLLLTGQRTSKP